VISISMGSGLLDGMRVRPGITKVSRDDRGRGGCTCCASDVLSWLRANEPKLFECCILMLLVSMLHAKSEASHVG